MGTVHKLRIRKITKVDRTRKEIAQSFEEAGFSHSEACIIATFLIRIHKLETAVNRLKKRK